MVRNDQKTEADEQEGEQDFDSMKVRQMISPEDFFAALDLQGSRADRLIFHEIVRRQVDGYEPDPMQSDSDGDPSGVQNDDGTDEIGLFSIN